MRFVEHSFETSRAPWQRCSATTVPASDDPLTGRCGPAIEYVRRAVSAHAVPSPASDQPGHAGAGPRIPGVSCGLIAPEIGQPLPRECETSHNLRVGLNEKLT